MTTNELVTIRKGLLKLRKRLRKLNDRLDNAKLGHICTSYDLFAFKDEGRQLTRGHLPSLDWHDSYDR